MESLSKRSSGEPPGPGSSVDKLLMIRAEQALGSLEMDVAPAARDHGSRPDAGTRYIYSRAASIYGGTGADPEEHRGSAHHSASLADVRENGVTVAVGVDKRTELSPRRHDLRRQGFSCCP